MQTNSRQATHRHQERKYVTMSCHAANCPARATNRDGEKRNGLRPRSGCHGGLTVLPCGAMRGNRDNCSYSTTTLFVALIRTYTQLA